jgi:hypothetical protein
VRSTKPATRASIAPSRSRFFPPTFLPIPTAAPASSAKDVTGDPLKDASFSLSVSYRITCET